MNWKEQLKTLEQNKQWDTAIEFMQQIIKENPKDMDAYLFMNFLLVDLVIEEDYDQSKFKIYWSLAKWYFEESYEKFCNNAEYLYLTAKTAVMGEWLFGIEQRDYEAMIEKAKELEPNNLVYKENYYWKLSNRDPKNPELIAYAYLVLDKNSPIKTQLKDKGTLGEYILGMKESWCEGVLRNAGLMK